MPRRSPQGGFPSDVQSSYSAALCRGLIEARRCRCTSESGRGRGIPRLYAAASLKPMDATSWSSGRMPRGYSAALCRGLIEASRWLYSRPAPVVYSAALCRGLIEASAVAAPPHQIRRRMYSAALCRGLIEATVVFTRSAVGHRQAGRIPRLYAAASLKRDELGRIVRSPSLRTWYSAALCRGLIEAALEALVEACTLSGIPRLYAAASLKRRRVTIVHHQVGRDRVFRGFMPRPH